MDKDMEEIMVYYDRLLEIVKQISMKAEDQIEKLKGTVVADEIASDFSDIGMIYARELFKSNLITQEQYNIVKSIDEILDAMSKDQSLWTEDALKNSKEWEYCRMIGKVLLSTLI